MNHERWSWQNEEIFEKLNKCNKQAAVFPEVVAKYAENFLRKRHSRDQVYLGKEILFQSGLYFSIVTGDIIDMYLMPAQNLVTRYTGFRALEILARWKHFVDFVGKV